MVPSATPGKTDAVAATPRFCDTRFCNTAILQHRDYLEPLEFLEATTTTDDLIASTESGPGRDLALWKR